MDIQVLGNKTNPSVIVIGVIHGDEPQGEYLIKEYFKSHTNTALLMIPCLNKTGYEKGTRTNINGVDLNRNFPAKNWVEGDKGNYYGGGSPASEEETRYVMSLVEKYNPKTILTLHSPYKVVNYDGGGEEGKKLAEKISAIIGYPISDDIGYPTPGSFGTWAGIERNIPVITVELSEDTAVKELKMPVFKIFEMLENY